jgi:hypothetical protein
MKLRRSAEPAKVRRLFGAAPVDAWLAAAVVAMTLGAVVGAEIGLARELRLDRVPDWLSIAGGVAVLLFAVAYGRWLLMRLHHDDAPRWRLSAWESGRLLPTTVMTFWVAGGFASYSSPGDWALAAVAALFVGNVFVPAAVRLLTSRRAEASDHEVALARQGRAAS